MNKTDMYEIYNQLSTNIHNDIDQQIEMLNEYREGYIQSCRNFYEKCMEKLAIEESQTVKPKEVGSPQEELTECLTILNDIYDDLATIFNRAWDMKYNNGVGVDVIEVCITNIPCILRSIGIVKTIIEQEKIDDLYDTTLSDWSKAVTKLAKEVKHKV